MKNPIDAVAHIKHAAVLKANLQRLKQTLASDEELAGWFAHLAFEVPGENTSNGYADMFL